MTVKNIFVLFALMLPGISWGSVEPVPEPGILPLLVAGGIAALVVKIMGRKR